MTFSVVGTSAVATDSRQLFTKNSKELNSVLKAEVSDSTTKEFNTLRMMLAVLVPIWCEIENNGNENEN